MKNDKTDVLRVVEIVLLVISILVHLSQYAN